MSLPTALKVIRLVTKVSLHLQVSSMGVKSLKNSSKYEMDNCIRTSNTNLSGNGIFGVS